MEAVSSLYSIGISLVPIQREIAEKINLRYPYLVPGKIPSNVYPGIPEIPTIQVFALLVVNADLDEDLVYRVTSLLWSSRTQALLRAGHPQGSAISPDSALSGNSVPLHKGAKRYYREHGLLTKESE